LLVGTRRHTIGVAHQLLGSADHFDRIEQDLADDGRKAADQAIEVLGDAGDFIPALDRCATSGTNEADIFGLARPQDLMRPDFSGPFDAGAIERPSDDRIFADGFEASGPFSSDDRRRAE